MLLYREIQLQQYTVITKYQNGLIFRITHMQSKAYWENHKQNSHWEDLCSYYGCYVFLKLILSDHVVTSLWNSSLKSDFFLYTPPSYSFVGSARPNPEVNIAMWKDFHSALV
jgi:hypothetical protein